MIAQHETFHKFIEPRPLTLWELSQDFCLGCFTRLGGCSCEDDDETEDVDP